MTNVSIQDIKSAKVTCLDHNHYFLFHPSEEKLTFYFLCDEHNPITINGDIESILAYNDEICHKIFTRHRSDNDHFDLINFADSSYSDIACECKERTRLHLEKSKESKRFKVVCPNGHEDIISLPVSSFTDVMGFTTWTYTPEQ